MLQTSPIIMTSITLVDKKNNEYPINVEAIRSVTGTDGVQWFAAKFGHPKEYLLGAVYAEKFEDVVQRVASEFSIRHNIVVNPHKDAVKKLRQMLV